MSNTNLKYVPILKWKRAEMGALAELTPERKASIIPLVELVMPKPKSKANEKSYDELYEEVLSIFRQKRIFEIPNEIREYWGTSTIIVDFTLLYPSELKHEAFTYVVKTAKSFGIDIVPVVNFSDSKEYKSLVVQSRNTALHNLCLRVNTVDLNDVDSLNIKIQKYLHLPGSKASTTSLLVDVKNDNGDNYPSYIAASQRINNLNDWKHFIFSSGSFPVDLSDCKLDEDNYIERTDWLKWVKYSSKDGIIRAPIFSDYGIRHPIYNESFQFLEPTASIKYTCDSQWYVIKGKKRKYNYFLAGAKLLKGSGLFYGEEFSAGDKYVGEKADHYVVYAKNPKVKGTGTTELWLKAGMNHHLSVVVDQLAN